MLKNKSKLLLIILMVITIALSPLSFADDEDVTQNTQDEAVNKTVKIVNSESEESQEVIEDNAIQTVQEGNEIADLTKHEDQYIIGDSVTIEDTIDGNLYVLANEVTIKSQIIGNAFICAKSITLPEQCYISNSLYAVAEDITITGIAYDVYTTSNNITIAGYIYRDLHSFSNNINLYGTVGRNASIGAEKISFEKVESAVSEDDGSTNEFISAQGKIMGNLNYSSKEEMEIPEGIVEGEVKFEATSDINVTPNYFLSILYFMLLVIAVWALLKWLAPKFVENSSNLVINKPLKTIGLGLLGLIVIPAVSIILILANVTASIGLLVLATYLILICVSKVIFVIAVNNILAKKLKFEKTLKTFLLLLVTSIIAKALTIIPFAGIVFSIVYIIIGMGIIVRSLVSKKDKEEK